MEARTSYVAPHLMNDLPQHIKLASTNLFWAFVGPRVTINLRFVNFKQQQLVKRYFGHASYISILIITPLWQSAADSVNEWRVQEQYKPCSPLLRVTYN